MSVLALVGAACGSPGKSSSNDRPSAGKTEGVPAVPESTRKRLQEWWALYEGDDPDWPAARRAWLAEPPAVRSILIESILRELILATNESAVGRGTRAERELVAIGEPAVGYLIEMGEAGDEILRQQTSGILALIGDDAVDPILGALAPSRSDRSAKAEAYRRHLVETLGSIGDPRAYETLVAMRGVRDWKTRAAVATALGGLPDDRVPNALAAMARAEDDEFVAARIAAALGRHPDPTSVEAVIGLLERYAASADSLDVVHACSRALRTLTGQRFGNDPADWRGWWRRQGRDWQPPAGGRE